MTAVGERPYDRRRLSYANTFEHPLHRAVIKTIEAATGKLRLLRLIRRFEAMGVPHGQRFWTQALGVMGIELDVPPAMLARIPARGPLVIVANHPHGLIDGMVLGELMGRVRGDYKILTRSLLTGVAEIDRFMIPVPFPHEADALAKSLDMRRRAMAHLAAGGCVVLFPSGQVATSETAFGPVIEAPWSPFTAKMIRQSGAAVVPILFPGQNSRAYHIANRISPVLRQGLLLHEVVRALGRSQAPRIGRAIAPAEIAARQSDPRAFMAWLRETTLAL
ncbi:acyltransferase [Palleronia sediminis]|uniref:Acyltransferase n=1 Tax=Palleronia sediminis TaxID=2547833 RepID=A0A4R6AEJ0_9RHOB|nr:lysophospholipid acyltransferase family protein [Palleronia sediminis]TDL79896.1 acyltransferase [Palleronia sediminis]